MSNRTKLNEMIREYNEHLENLKINPDTIKIEQLLDILANSRRIQRSIMKIYDEYTLQNQCRFED